MFSEKAKKNAEACRFCWMCRHLCPVALKSGREVHTPRAKGLLVSMANRGYDIDADAACVMYACLLCGACTNDCATGYEPPVYIREARTEAIVRDVAPAEVMRVIEKLETAGNIFGAGRALCDAPPSRTDAEVVLWLGATARYKTPGIANAVISLLQKAGVRFTTLADEPDSGVALFDLMGCVEEAVARARACAERINALKARTLVVLDSYDAAAFLHEYAGWGIALAPGVVTATAFVDHLVAAGALRPPQFEALVAYHDPSRLARDLDEHEPARRLLRTMGCTLDEMFQNRRLAKCCGNALVREYAPELAAKTSAGRWEDLLRTEARVLVSACPQSHYALEMSRPEGCELVNLFELLDGRGREGA